MKKEPLSVLDPRVGVSPSGPWEAQEVVRSQPTPKQAAVLDVLLHGRETHMDQIGGRVWGHDPDGGPEDMRCCLRQHVCALRKLLRPGFEIAPHQWYYTYRLLRR